MDMFSTLFLFTSNTIRVINCIQVILMVQMEENLQKTIIICLTSMIDDRFSMIGRLLDICLNSSAVVLRIAPRSSGSYHTISWKCD